LIHRLTGEEWLRKQRRQAAEHQHQMAGSFPRNVDRIDLIGKLFGMKISRHVPNAPAKPTNRLSAPDGSADQFCPLPFLRWLTANANV
jgi:hypothetical protein